MMSRVVSNLGVTGLILAVGTSAATSLRAQEASNPAPVEPDRAEVTTPASTEETSAQTAPEAPTSPETATPEAPATVESGTVSISSEPAGKLYVDGVDSGLQTPVAALPLSAGTHELKVLDPATGAMKSAVVTVDAGATLTLSFALESPASTGDTPTEAPPADAAPPAAGASAEPAVDGDTATTDAPTESEPAAEAPTQDWTWTAVAGWGSLGAGAMSLLSSAVVLTTEGDPDRETLGFTLFGTGAALVVTGGSLLYLDSESADATAAPTAARGTSSSAVTLR